VVGGIRAFPGEDFHEISFAGVVLAAQHQVRLFLDQPIFLQRGPIGLQDFGDIVLFAGLDLVRQQHGFRFNCRSGGRGLVAGGSLAIGAE